MPHISRYRKSKPNDRRVIKKGKVTKSTRFSDKPSIETLKKNIVTTSVKLTPEQKLKNVTTLKCFENWDLNNDGILNTSDVDLWIDNGFLNEAKMLSSMIISKTLPKMCGGNGKQVTSVRTESVKRSIEQKKTKKTNKVQRTFKALKNLKKVKLGGKDV